MDKEHSNRKYEKYAILELCSLTGIQWECRVFVLLSLAIYFNMSSFLYQLYHHCQQQDICCRYLLSG